MLDWLEKWSSQTWPWVAGQKRRKSLAVARVNHMSFDLLITLNHRCYPQMQQTYRVVAWFSSPFCNGQTTTSLKGFPTAPTTNLNGFPSISTIRLRFSTPQRVSTEVPTNWTLVQSLAFAPRDSCEENISGWYVEMRFGLPSQRFHMRTLNKYPGRVGILLRTHDCQVCQNPL